MKKNGQWCKRWMKLKEQIEQEVNRKYINEEEYEFIKGEKFGYRQIRLQMEKIENEKR